MRKIRPGAVEVDDVVVDEVAVAVVDVDARAVAGELGVPDFGVVALALNGDPAVLSGSFQVATALPFRVTVKPSIKTAPALT